MNSYESVYGVGLLDDLHNYFPALLYEQGRFISVQQVLQYVRTQMTYRFNLYSYGQEQYRVQQPIHHTPVWMMPQQANVMTPPSPVYTTIPVVPPPFVLPVQQQRTTPFTQQPQQTQQTHQPQQTQQPQQVVNLWNDNDISLTNELLRMLGTSFASMPYSGGIRNISRFNPAANPWTPVIVRPTARIIEENSEILTGLSGLQCAVCQDDIEQTEQCRRIRSCQHIYHKVCIDTWFQESVHCPTCRHDIREQTTSN